MFRARIEVLEVVRRVVLWGNIYGCSGCITGRGEPVFACSWSQNPICQKGKSGDSVRPERFLLLSFA